MPPKQALKLSAPSMLGFSFWKSSMRTVLIDFDLSMMDSVPQSIRPIWDGEMGRVGWEVIYLLGKRVLVTLMNLVLLFKFF